MEILVSAALSRALEYQAWSDHQRGALTWDAYVQVAAVARATICNHDLPPIPDGIKLFGAAPGEDPDAPGLMEAPTPEQITAARAHYGHDVPAAARLLEVAPRTWRAWERGERRMRPELADRYVLAAMLAALGESWPYADTLTAARAGYPMNGTSQSPDTE